MKGIARTNLLFIMALLLPLIPIGISGQWWLFSVIAGCLILLGAIELIAVAKTKKTVSRHFWDWSDNHKTLAWIILGSMVVMWFGLIWHLAIEML